MKSLNLDDSFFTMDLVLLGMVSGLLFLLSHFHIEVFVGYMSLQYPVLHSLVPRYAFHMAGKSMMLVGVLL